MTWSYLKNKFLLPDRIERLLFGFGKYRVNSFIAIDGIEIDPDVGVASPKDVFFRQVVAGDDFESELAGDIPLYQNKQTQLISLFTINSVKQNEEKKKCKL